MYHARYSDEIVTESLFLHELGKFKIFREFIRLQLS